MLEIVRKFQACYYVVELQGDRMDRETKIFVNNDLDVVMARMQARNIARDMGFSTVDRSSPHLTGNLRVGTDYILGCAGI